MKTLLIIGASSNIGVKLIKKVSESYECVWAHYLHWNDELEELKKLLGEKIHFVCADLFQLTEIEKMISVIKESNFLPDHIVFFPMTRIKAQNFTKLTLKDYDNGWDLSIRSSIILSQAFLPKMKKNKYGKLIFMLSSVTSNNPPKYESAYITVKYALLGFMKSLASEYAQNGICINGVSPDMIQTKFISELPRLLVEQYAESKPQKRILNVDEVIPTFEFLLSEGADKINGENIIIQ